MPDIFNLQQISYTYSGTQKALSDISLMIGEGEIFSVIGANGSGKSTLLHILCGLIFASEGSVSFKDNPITEGSFKNADFNRRFRSSIGYVFQNSDAQLFCPTVFDELIFSPLQLGYPKEEAFERAESIMQMLSIGDIKDRPTYMLSGGEKKRVAIGAVLTANPEVVIFDEPLSNLDPKTRSFIIELIFRLNEAHKTIIIATHHLELVSHLQSRIAVLSEKHTLEKTGSCEEILRDTGLLMRTNLIGEYPHKHDGTVHKHISGEFLFNKHNHRSNIK
jgi:cobalt/nickel transport system ATP-binding protein